MFSNARAFFSTFSENKCLQCEWECEQVLTKNLNFYCRLLYFHKAEISLFTDAEGISARSDHYSLYTSLYVLFKLLLSNKN